MRVMAATDGMDGGSDAVAFAIKTATVMRAELHVITVVATPVDTGPAKPQTSRSRTNTEPAARVERRPPGRALEGS